MQREISSADYKIMGTLVREDSYSENETAGVKNVKSGNLLANSLKLSKYADIATDTSAV